MLDRLLTARNALRAGTADLHADLDGRFSAVDFHDAASYARFLQAQAPALFALEAAISEAPLARALGDWERRRRAPILRADLQALGCALPPPARGAALEGDALLGALYVLEGSRLGARVLVRWARASRDAHVRGATAYLAHGEGEALWPSFLQFIARREREGLDQGAVVAGARHAFGLFIQSAGATLQLS